jgi:chorismate lyase/3-hydroxybenzoate synthase
LDHRLRSYFGDPGEGSHPLGVIRYVTQGSGLTRRGEAPELRVHLARTAADVFAEVWTTDQPVESGQRGRIVYGHDGEYAFCAGRIPSAARYAARTRAAYLEAFGLLADLGYWHVFRMWNFIGHINEPNADGLEVYRDFCRGRAEAFGRSPLGNDRLPAATGIGSLGDGIGFYLLARRSGRHTTVENAQQVPAYRYPERYGPRAPHFARAAYLPLAGSLYVSGTASILGHETVHAGDVGAQCRTALANIAALIEPVNLARHGVREALDLTMLRTIKVYVRRQADHDVVRKLCGAAFSPTAGIVYLTTDMCRADLLVEIEGIVPGRDGEAEVLALPQGHTVTPRARCSLGSAPPQLPS